MSPRSGKKYLIAIIAAGLLFPARGFAESKETVHPISNPIYNDTAQPKTQITAIYAFHKFPNKISTTLGKIPVGGYLQVMALQIEYAINETLSLVANKDGIIFFNPDDTLNVHEGLADISAGAKWRFYSNKELDASLRGTFEIPLGSEAVFQGNGDGSVSPAILATYNKEKWQINNVIGAVFPFDTGEESMMGYFDLSAAYALTKKLFALLEFNWWHVYGAGEGKSDFSGQLGKTVPSVVKFDGPDFFNFGASHADDHSDLVTMAIGARYQLTPNAFLGAAWEIPLTEEENNLFDQRAYVNLAWKF